MSNENVCKRKERKRKNEKKRKEKKRSDAIENDMKYWAGIEDAADLVKWTKMVDPE